MTVDASINKADALELYGNIVCIMTCYIKLFLFFGFNVSDIIIVFSSIDK